MSTENTDPQFLSRLPEKIAGEVKQILPDLRVCKAYAGRFNLEELKNESIGAPAVLISVLNAKQARYLAGGYIEFNLSMAAFVVTKDRKNLDRDVAAAAICQVLMALIPEQKWNEPACGAARELNLQTIVSGKTKRQAISLWAVTWSQPITLFVLPEPNIIEPELYLGQSPNIGTGHEDDYVRIGGGL